ncbi:MAG: hypothetical protein WCK90_04720 [archaeon]
MKNKAECYARLKYAHILENENTQKVALLEIGRRMYGFAACPQENGMYFDVGEGATELSLRIAVAEPRIVEIRDKEKISLVDKLISSIKTAEGFPSEEITHCLNELAK